MLCRCGQKQQKIVSARIVRNVCQPAEACRILPARTDWQPLRLISGSFVLFFSSAAMASKRPGELLTTPPSRKQRNGSAETSADDQQATLTKTIAAGAAVAAAGGNCGEATSSLVCLNAESVLSKWSRGVQRIPIHKLGVSPLNRVISGKHVHRLGELSASRAWCASGTTTSGLTSPTLTVLWRLLV